SNLSARTKITPNRAATSIWSGIKRTISQEAGPLAQARGARSFRRSTGPAHALRAPLLSAEFGAHRPHHQSTANARTDRRHLMQHIGGKADYCSALLGYDVDFVVAAHFKFAAFIFVRLA